MIIYCVSPTYLRYIKEESEEYDFRLQGYGNLKAAREGLIKTNASDIYGFAYVSDKVTDHKLLDKFISLCDVISEYSKKRKRFLISLNDDSGLNMIFKGSKYKNLDFYVSRFDILTDTFIRREIFGTILTGYLGPYDNEPNVVEKKPSRFSLLEYKPLLPPLMLRALSPVRLKDTLFETTREDEDLLYLKESSILYYNIRLFGIMRKFTSNLDRNEQVEAMIEELKDPLSRSFASMAYDYVVERGIQGVTPRGIRIK